jgi:superoxide dismutase, Fe-Mn family
MFTEQQFSIPKLHGISERTIEEHKKLYTGYVKNANLIMDHIAELSKDSEKYAYELGELQRRFSFEWGGMRNHECYFKLLTETNQPDEASALVRCIESQWGSISAWSAQFQAIALTRGVGWAMLYWDPVSAKLVHGWVDEQQLGQLTGCGLVIALDMWEHSYVADYWPSGKKQYVIDFMNQMNWKQAEANFVAVKGNS